MIDLAIYSTIMIIVVWIFWYWIYKKNLQSIRLLSIFMTSLLLLIVFVVWIYIHDISILIIGLIGSLYGGLRILTWPKTNPDAVKL